VLYIVFDVAALHRRLLLRGLVRARDQPFGLRDKWQLRRLCRRDVRRIVPSGRHVRVRHGVRLSD
jgi:hypothetical protein